MDAILLQAVTEEVRREAVDLRIEKVQQPARDAVVLTLRGNRRLLLNAGAGAPRLQWTAFPRDNPAEPPMFCMLLRKHLTGGRIAAITQPPLERLVRIEVDATDDLGRSGRRTLVLEAMGRRSNLILLDGEGRILDCLRRVDAEMSAERQVLPGLFYREPAAGGRMVVTEETEEGFRAGIPAASVRGEEFLLGRYFGLSRLYAREIVFRASGETDAVFSAPREWDRLWEELEKFIQAVRESRFTPILLRRDGRPAEALCFPAAQYGPAAEAQRYDRFSPMLDDFYAQREREERSRARGAELMKTAATARDRLRRKLAMQERDYAETQNRDRLRLCGDLITANLYRMERGAASLTCENYYGEPGEEITVPLDPLLTPQQNAAKYYKRYTKAKTAEKMLSEQMAIARRDLSYLESVLEELSRGETEQDFAEIREELRQAGYLRRSERTKERRLRPQKPREYRTASGLRLLVGRNNRQNEALTKGADHRDLWLHTRDIHGAHGILSTAGAQPPEADLLEAAALVAWFSQGRESGNVAVDVTRVKNVKKLPGGRPGMVTYTGQRTVYVTPKEPREP